MTVEIREKERSEPVARMDPSPEVGHPTHTGHPIALHSRSLEEYGLMSPSALLGGSFLAGAGGEKTQARGTPRDTLCTLPPGHNPTTQTSAPDTTAPPQKKELGVLEHC